MNSATYPRVMPGRLQDILGDNSIERACFKDLKVHFRPMVHRYKKCSDIIKVTSGGIHKIIIIYRSSIIILNDQIAKQS